jgi:hypothetical protein
MDCALQKIITRLYDFYLIYLLDDIGTPHTCLGVVHE